MRVVNALIYIDLDIEISFAVHCALELELELSMMMMIVFRAIGNSREFGLFQISPVIPGNFAKVQISAFSRHFSSKKRSKLSF